MRVEGVLGKPEVAIFLSVVAVGLSLSQIFLQEWRTRATWEKAAEALSLSLSLSLPILHWITQSSLKRPKTLER